jgi:steroid delta-isomerase-like uncharacterized protein
MMPNEIAEAVVRRYDEELYGGGQLSVADEILAPDFVFFGPAAGIRGPEEFKNFVQVMHSAFPDLSFETHQIISDGRKVARVATMRGTHLGDFRGIPPSGRKIAVPRIDTFIVEEGRILEGQAFMDHQAFFELLQAPAEEPAHA